MPDSLDDNPVEQAVAKPAGSPPVGPKAPASTKAVVDARVTAVFALLVAGFQTAGIRRAVAKQQRKEREKRAAAHAAAVTAGDADPTATSYAHVPQVWGDAVMPDRTLDRYIAKAKAVFDDNAAQFTAQRNRELATQKARLDDLFHQARRNGRWYAALKAIELQVELFGLRDHARALQLSSGTEEGRTDGPKLLPTDPAERLAAFGSLMAGAVAASPELREQLGALAPRTSVMP